MLLPNYFIIAIVAIRLAQLNIKSVYISDVNIIYKIYNAIYLLLITPHLTEIQFQAHSKSSFRIIERYLGGYQNIRLLLNIDESQSTPKSSNENNVIDFFIERKKEINSLST